MAKRIKLAQRQLPTYSKGEEIMNMVTHIAGGALAVAVLVLCVVRAVVESNALAVCGCAVYGGTMIALYSISSIYHGLPKSTGKKVMQVIDHCTIYYLIVGTYTAILTCALIPAHPVIGWCLFSVEWGLAIFATVLTAIDLHKYRIISMVMYICMGWGILPFLPQMLALLGGTGFGFLLAGGIAYTVGAILYGIGSKHAWFHSVFHIFVVLGSFLQFLSIYFYAI